MWLFHSWVDIFCCVVMIWKHIFLIYTLTCRANKFVLCQRKVMNRRNKSNKKGKKCTEVENQARNLVKLTFFNELLPTPKLKFPSKNISVLNVVCLFFPSRTVTVRKERKPEAVNRDSLEEHLRNNSLRDTILPRVNRDYIFQVSDEIEVIVTQSLSQEFSRTESRILRALLKLDDFLLSS